VTGGRIAVINTMLIHLKRLNDKSIKMMIFIISISPIFLLSCGIDLGLSTGFDKDVSEIKEFWGGYELNQKYELNRYVFLEKKRDWAKKLVLVPQGNQEHLGSMLWNAPGSKEEYLANTQNWPDVVGIIDEGAKVRIHKFGRHGAPLWGSSIYVIAEICDGPFKGKLVDIGDISLVYNYDKDPYPLKPDSRILKKAE
jgi:hypothetical protein